MAMPATQNAMLTSALLLDRRPALIVQFGAKLTQPGSPQLTVVSHTHSRQRVHHAWVAPNLLRSAHRADAASESIRRWFSDRNDWFVLCVIRVCNGICIHCSPITFGAAMPL